MAFTNYWTATIYGVANTLDNKNTGWQLSQPTAPSYQAFNKSTPINLYAIPAQTLNATPGPIVVNSIIELLPTGSRNQSLKLYTDATFALLATNGA